MSTETKIVNATPDFVPPFLIFLAVGIIFGLILAYLHVRYVKSLVKERLRHLPKAKKVKVKKAKKSKKKKDKKKKEKKEKKSKSEDKKSKSKK